MSVRKAVVLAAGLGTRLRPLTCSVPKPLLPVWGVPMLARIVDMLRARGVDDIVVNCHYLHEQVEAWCRENGCMASYEPEILGTGGVLNPLREWIGDEPFYLVNGDIVVENVPDLASHVSRFMSSSEMLGMALVTEEGPRTIEVEPESGYVTNWKSEDAGFPGTYTYCGLALLKPEILKYVEPSGFSTVISAYAKAMMDGKFVKAIWPKELLWTDAGTIASYIDINRDGDDNAFADIPQIRAAIESSRVGVESASVGVGSASVGVGSSRSGGVKDSDVTLTGTRATLSAPHETLSDSKATQSDTSDSKATLSDPKMTLSDPIQFLGARGSDRAFFKTEMGIVIVYDDAKRGENAKYVGHAKWLKAHGAPVPDVVADLPAYKTTVMDWGGSEKKMTLDDYADVVRALEKFGQLGAAAVADGLDLEPCFDAALFRWERELFAEHCLGTRYRMTMPKDVETELEKVAEILEKEPKALVHRDFQSTNVLWKNGRLSFIDFQGMRLGPAAYDLASLVYDPYVTFTDEGRRALVALYAKESGREEFVKVLPFAAVQRLVQCLGAYGRLASVGQPQFGKHVLPALENLLAAADEAGLDALGALAEDLIGREMKNG